MGEGITVNVGPVVVGDVIEFLTVWADEIAENRPDDTQHEAALRWAVARIKEADTDRGEGAATPDDCVCGFGCMNGLVPATGRGGDGYEPCPECGTHHRDPATSAPLDELVLMNIAGDIDAVAELLAKVDHYQVYGDSWHSCPLSEGGSTNRANDWCICDAELCHELAARLRRIAAGIRNNERKEE